MKNIKKKLAVLGLAAFCVASSSVIASAASAGFGGTLPATGTEPWGVAEKTSSSTTFTLRVTSVGNDNNYRFWGYKDGQSYSNNATTKGSATGTGTKYCYYGGSDQARELIGEYVGLAAKTGPTVYTPMWFEGTFQP